MGAEDVDEWWIPDIKVAEYFFKKNISEISNFYKKNRRDLSAELKSLEFLSDDYISLDDNFELIVDNNKIQSLNCCNFFYVNDENVIGKKIEFLLDELKKRFSNDNILFEYDDASVEYENGDIQIDVSIDEYSIFVTLDETGTVLSVSVISPCDSDHL
jgi:hypothetical protein